MDKLHFGTAGIPLSTEDRTTENGIKRAHELGLTGMELEFVRNVNISKEKAPGVKKVADESHIKLTAHGSYFINFNASEPAKAGASRSRVLQAARILELCGGYSVCFHPAYRMGAPKDHVYNNVKKQFAKLMEEVRSHSLKVWIRPETAGKLSQFGNLEELIKLSQEFDQVLPCIDFSHLRACLNGKMNSYEDYSSVLEQIEKGLGKEALKNMHIHAQGIAYSEKGEKNHLSMADDPKWDYKNLMKALKEFKVCGCVVCESPVLESDAVVLKKVYDSL
ncbi:MAG: TIM barrel protein [Candidatus Micrarchaeota archaeon]